MAGVYERDAIVILATLERHGYKTLAELRELTQINETDIRRFLNNPFLEYWTRQKFMDLREENPRLYKQLLQDCKWMKNNAVQVNTSKRQYLEFYANYYGYRIEKSPKYPYIAVFRRREGETFPAANLNTVEIN